MHIPSESCSEEIRNGMLFLELYELKVRYWTSNALAVLLFRPPPPKYSEEDSWKIYVNYMRNHPLPKRPLCWHLGSEWLVEMVGPHDVEPRQPSRSVRWMLPAIAELLAKYLEPIDPNGLLADRDASEMFAVVVVALSELLEQLVALKFAARLAQWVSSPCTVTTATAFGGRLADSVEFFSVVPMHFGELVPVLFNPTALAGVVSTPPETTLARQGTLTHVGVTEPDYRLGA